jgi:predicted transcriptional regulator
MTLTLELQPEEVTMLDARAKAMGMDIAAVLHDLIAQIMTAERPLYETATLDEWERALDKLSDDVDPAIPSIPDEALQRESLYETRVR